ncbi:MAG: hypothetical protein H0T42_21770 [Deltaproteobacteria bacterium]|nr:hypothetical protein [Deltaproteobacteria bacterium]
MSTDDDEAPARPERERARSEPVRSEAAREVAREERRDDRRDDDDGHDALPETLRRRLESLVPELVKKTFQAGMGAVFSTEEGIRRLARENLPEVAGYIASSADGAKDKVFEVIARETREFLSTLNLTDEIAKILTTLSFEIKTEIRFIPNSERVMGAEPDVKASVRLKRNDKPDKPDKADKAERTEKDSELDKEDGASRDSRSRLRFWRRDGGGEGDGGDTGDK